MTTIPTMLDQIGTMNILAISGGRVLRTDENTVHLPVSNGYVVEVKYVPGRDLYTVSRLLKRGAKVFQKGTIEDVYAEDLGEIAYLTSCFRSYEMTEIGYRS